MKKRDHFGGPARLNILRSRIFGGGMAEIDGIDPKSFLSLAGREKVGVIEGWWDWA